MINRFIFLVLVLVAAKAKAQEFPSDLWHHGMAVLVNEDTITGKVKYNLEKNLIQIESQKKLYTYSSNRVFYFQIFDETIDSYREFYALPYALVNQYESPIFFEVLVEGKLTLLCREAIVSQAVNDNNPYRMSLSYSRNVLIYTYYFLDDKGNITLYTKKKRDLLKALSRRANKIDEYMKTNRLRADKRHDLSRIISFYNGII